MKTQKMNKVASLLGLALVSGTVALMTPITTPAQAAPYYQSGYNNSPTVMLNGTALNTSVSPIVENGSTLVPMRDIFEALGATVLWDQQNQTIRAQKGSTAIWLQIGNTNARVGNQQVALNQPPILSMGSTLVPLRFVSEALGANVDWNGNTRVVQITTNGNSSVDQQAPYQNTYNDNSNVDQQAPYQSTYNDNSNADEQAPYQNTYNDNSNADQQAPYQNTYNDNSNIDEQASPEYTNNENSDVNYQDFYQNLSPYGQWLNDPEYGYVWQPRVDQSFRPYYSGGHWVMTQYGNTWVSDYSWGWAAFHYGRWDLSDNNGWIWVPGNQWAPAWVSWRSGGGYYGWAPLSPSFNINISIGNYHAPNNWYSFVPQRHLYDHGYSQYNDNNYRSNNHYVVSNHIVNLIHNTTIIHNTYINNHNTYITGPRIKEVESVTHQKVRIYNITNNRNASSTKIQNNSINIYRPVINNRPKGRVRTRISPRNVVRLNHSIFTKSIAANVVNRNVAKGAENRNFAARNNHAFTAPHVKTLPIPIRNPKNSGANVNANNARRQNPQTHNNRNYTAPRIIAPRNPAPNLEAKGKNVNADNVRNQNVPAHNDRTYTAPRVIAPHNPAPNPENNHRNVNADNARYQNPPTRNDRTYIAPQVSAPRDPAPNPENNRRNVNADSARNQNAPGRNNRTYIAPQVAAPRNPAPNPENNRRNVNADNARYQNPAMRNDRTYIAPQVTAPRNPAPNSENDGRNANPDNTRRGDRSERNDRTITAHRVDAPRNPAPNPENNGRNANPENARNQNPPARNDRIDTAPRNPAPNPGRNANDNNGRNQNATPLQTRGNQSNGSTASPTNPKDHSKDNSNQSNDHKHRNDNGQTNNQQ
ncbi:MAG: DUF6600 domain-containing protein [Abditibacteriaceae bacterium]